MALIDTHSIVEDLIAAGFAKSQAEALTRLKILHYEDLASKKDLENIENITHVLDAKISEVKTEVAEVKTEVKIIKSELHVIKWMIGSIGALMIMLISIQLGKLLM